MIFLKLYLIAMVCYLIGSIPFSYIITKWKGGTDIRSVGSGNVGATNASRVLGRWYGIIIGILDFTKGLIAVFLAGLIMGNSYFLIYGYAFGMLGAQVLGGFIVLAGHIWPIFLGFKGGKGVATFFGALSALCPMAGLVGGEIFLIIVLIWGYASLGSIAGVIATYVILIPMFIINGFPLEYLVYTLGGTLVIGMKHKENILRLLQGKERPMGKNNKSAPSLS
ncbi:MAG: glycerol-3-phosphate 1-O-acyltransferase PlsY [Chloroflexi bacterium]|nr:glycerol-3-phosphate 1-O-acyltransferase PlsY [Chloroflexota bacterium]